MINGPSTILFDVNGNPLTTLSDGSLLVTIADGYVTANFPATQPVSGSVSITGTPTVSVSNFPATQPVSGSVSVSNFPAFPAIQPVSQSGSWTVGVNNFPALQAVDGYVGITGTATVSGSVSVSNFPAIQAVSQSGNWTVLTNKSSTSVVTAVAPSTSSVVLLAANANRTFAHVSNAANKNLFIKLGTAASLTSYTDVILSGNAYDVPGDYTGVISGIWASGVNAVNVLVTELTP
jgi:hypothetical protein